MAGHGGAQPLHDRCGVPLVDGEERGDRFSLTAAFSARDGHRPAVAPHLTRLRKDLTMDVGDTAIPQVDPAGAGRLADDGALLLDVREDEEWIAGHAPGAVHLPLGRLDPTTIPHDRIVVAVCRSGRRSGAAAERLAASGVDVRNLAGGMQAWAADGRPVQRDDGRPGAVA